MALGVLIADDNEFNRWLLAEQLQGLQADVVLACNGQEAWNLLQNRSFDVAFLDVNMPLIGGFALVRKIRNQPSLQGLFCVAVTAHAQPGQRQQLLGAGFNDCLIKPIVLADLGRIISKFHLCGGDVDAGAYAGFLLRKVEGNRELAQILLHKLFEQAPEQIERLQHHLQENRFLDAWEVAHQLHGTFSFFGFEDFRAQAGVLEQSLLHVADGGVEAVAQLQVLEAGFVLLMKKQNTLLELVV